MVSAYLELHRVVPVGEVASGVIPLLQVLSESVFPQLCHNKVLRGRLPPKLEHVFEIVPLEPKAKMQNVCQVEREG